MIRVARELFQETFPSDKLLELVLKNNSTIYIVPSNIDLLDNDHTFRSLNSLKVQTYFTISALRAIKLTLTDYCKIAKYIEMITSQHLEHRYKHYQVSV